MQNGLTDGDRDRIATFVSKSKYERTPEMLMPESDEEEAEDEAADA